MAAAILTNEARLTKRFSDIIEIQFKKKEFSMKKPSVVMKDLISAKERLNPPLSYKWLKFKTKYFGLPTLQRGNLK